MKILIAEDNRSLQTGYSMIMEAWDFDCDIVSDGREAVKYAKKNRTNYDLCLMDIDMPVMDGYKATRIIRCQDYYLPIMAVTGNDRIKEEYLKAGIDDFLEKPIDPDALFTKINELTVKALKLYNDKDNVHIRKENPMDSDELNELRELHKRGLTKLSIVGKEHKFVVHQNIQNKISHDFIGKGKLLAEFLDHAENEPGIVHFYAEKSNATNKRYLLPEDYVKLAKEENEEMKKYTEKAEYPDKDDMKVNG